jgi:hypothetical protein
MFLTINVPLILKVRDIKFFFSWAKHIIGHFSGFFEGAGTFLPLNCAYNMKKWHTNCVHEIKESKGRKYFLGVKVQKYVNYFPIGDQLTDKQDKFPLLKVGRVHLVFYT